MAPSSGKVVIVGGGWGGATAARYIRMWSDGRVDVTLVEPTAAGPHCVEQPGASGLQPLRLIASDNAQPDGCRQHAANGLKQEQPLADVERMPLGIELIREVTADKILPEIKIPGKVIQTSLSNADEAALSTALEAAKTS